jgi:hypothetical protein
MYYNVKLNKRPLVASSHYEDFRKRTAYTSAGVINLSSFVYCYDYEIRASLTGQTGIDIEPSLRNPLWHVNELHKDKLAEGYDVHAVTMDMQENSVPRIIDAVVEKAVLRADNLFMVRLAIGGRYIFTGVCWGNIEHASVMLPLSHGLVEPAVNSVIIRDRRASAVKSVADYFAEREAF